MMRLQLGLCAVVLFAAGCASVDLPDYYSVRVDPEIGELSIASQPGNTGSVVVSLSGSGFGDSIDDVVVLLNNRNAEVRSVTDDEIIFETPPGGISGGAVDLLVATETGYAVADDVFFYETPDYSDTEDGFYVGQESYIQLINMYESCYGGVGPSGCEGITFTGQTGIEGSAEFFNFSFPRIHTAKQGWLSSVDATVEGWNVYPPELSYPSGIDNLRERVGTFSVTNEAWGHEEVCVDFGDDLIKSPKACGNEDYVEYDSSVLQFCEGEDAKDGGSYLYGADWPINRNFFQGAGGPDEPVLVQLNLEEKSINDLDIMLPPPLVSLGTSGFPSAESWWNGNMSACPDGDGDGQATLDEDGLVFEWVPADRQALLDGSGSDVLDINTYVHVSMTFVEFGWFGLETVGFRAATTVGDYNALDEGSGAASVGVPNWVLYQFPTPNFNWSGYDQFLDKGRLGSFDSGASYLFVEVYRVTDYKIRTDKGPLVLSYVTGDLTLPGWENPIEDGDTCGDCIDGDGDGWVDSSDPDCNESVGGLLDEVNATSSFTCNDGIDNDNNGLVDSDDPLCENGWDGETTCGDGIDNDLDGWVDSLDADCNDPNDQEDGAIAGGTCSDGVDNDLDGWVDGVDLACTDGRDDEDDGFSGTQCNDGIDNDGNNDVDSLDPYCFEVGPSSDSEQPVYISRCINETDDDEDGFIDALDPDCEYYPYSRESLAFHDPESFPLVAGCYDGVDNDGDGSIDAADPSCWNPVLGYLADGFLQDESVANGSGCSDGTDEDMDTWTDGQDPDCVAGDPSAQDEVGIGTTVCNDGIDNDNDGLIDGEDSDYCKSALGGYEGPG
jgi:hypothetical protein